MMIVTAAERPSLVANMVTAGVELRPEYNNFVFASAEEELNFIATASEKAVFVYASSLAVAADETSHEKIANNRGFLSGLMARVKKSIQKHKGAIIGIGAVVGTLALIAGALTFMAKNPQRVGNIGLNFAVKAENFAMGLSKALTRARRQTAVGLGRIRQFAAGKLESVVNTIKQAASKLKSLAAKGASKAGQAAGKGVGRAGKGLSNFGNARNTKIGSLARKAGGAIRKGAGSFVGKSVRLGQQAAPAAKQALQVVK